MPFRGKARFYTEIQGRCKASILFGNPAALVVADGTMGLSCMHAYAYVGPVRTLRQQQQTDASFRVTAFRTRTPLSRLTGDTTAEERKARRAQNICQDLFFTSRRCRARLSAARGT